MIPALPLFNHKVIAADAAITTESSHRVMHIILAAGAAAAATLELNNSDDGSGTDLISVNAVTGSTEVVDLAAIGGILFSAGIYADIGGAGAAAYIRWD